MNEGRSKTDLPLIHAGPETEHGVYLNSDDRMSFAKQGGGDNAAQIRFARGRMARVDCAIAQG